MVCSAAAIHKPRLRFSRLGTRSTGGMHSARRDANAVSQLFECRASSEPLLAWVPRPR